MYKYYKKSLLLSTGYSLIKEQMKPINLINLNEAVLRTAALLRRGGRKLKTAYKRRKKAVY